jgi:hypothetical protein
VDVTARALTRAAVERETYRLQREIDPVRLEKNRLEAATLLELRCCNIAELPAALRCLVKRWRVAHARERDLAGQLMDLAVVEVAS